MGTRVYETDAFGSFTVLPCHGSLSVIPFEGAGYRSWLFLFPPPPMALGPTHGNRETYNVSGFDNGCDQGLFQES